MPTNRLAQEKSPYLLQHAHNPVDWRPWGDDAFEVATRENKPVFLSVGYSTCHWCHVMERESFENEEIAAILNRYFVPIKVDREERPDVDRVYMLFVQATTGSGGWPMSVWLTPDRKPFFGGTYFPPDNRYGRPGFKAVLERLARAWMEDRARIQQSGSAVIEQLRRHNEISAGHAMPDRKALDAGFYAFRRSFDGRLGGFGSAPKFPRPSVLQFLLRYYVESKNEEALEMVLVTLREMAKGGMNDQLGGGFHRYSVDERWFVPHFEKMLYDQAQLAVTYTEAFKITRDGQYAAVARDVLDYILRDMTHPEGGFYSAEDADSATDPEHPEEKGEGAFYIWSHAEIEALLGEGDAAIVSFRFGIREEGNVDEDPQGEFTGRNILYQAHTLEETAARFESDVDEIRAILKAAAEKLLAARAKRPRPHLDDKILTGWNGMMISGFAKAAQAFDEPHYLEAARRAASFIRARLFDSARGVLLRRWRDGEPLVDAFLDDYGFLALAMIDLYETAFDSADLTFAITLVEKAIELFEDREKGAFFSTAAGAESLVLRLKDDYDGAEPSGNSAIVLALLHLARMMDRDDFRRSAEKTLEAFSTRLYEAPSAAPALLCALSFQLSRPVEIVLAGPSDQPAFAAMLSSLRRRFLPNAVVLHASDHEMPAIGGAPTAYLCENFACKLPVTEPQEFENMLNQMET